MRAPNSPQQKFFFLLLIAAGLVLIAPTVVRAIIIDDPVAATPTTPTTTQTPGPAAPTGCGSDPQFLARLATGNQFGPAAPEEVTAAQAEFAARRCSTDAALQVATSEYLISGFSDPATRVAKTTELLGDPAKWQASEDSVVAKLATAKAEIATMSGSYKTLDMVDQGRIIPEIYAVPVDAAPFKVLRYTWPDGTVKQFKLNCGYQPVEQSFPKTVPTKPTQPSNTQPKEMPKPKPSPTTTQPPGTTIPGTTAPPATQPPTTIPSSPTTTWKCQAAVDEGRTCGGGGAPGTPPYQPPSSLPPTPGYTPGGAEATAGNPAQGVILPPGNTTGTPGSTTGTNGGSSGTGGSAGVSNPQPTQGSGQQNTGTVPPPP